MAKQADYDDRLREALLTLAIVPVAGFDTATYWLKESLDRTTSFGAKVIASTALARFTRPRDADTTTAGDPVADVLAQDLLEAAGTYVRSIVRLPADSGVYFTGEVERRLNVLLEQIRPGADKDFEAYADTELERLMQELDRLFVIVRAEATRAAAGRPTKRLTPRERKLVSDINQLRTSVKKARPSLAGKARPVGTLGKEAPDPLSGFNIQKARTRLRQALREAEAPVPYARKSVEEIATLIERLQATLDRQSAHPPKEAGGNG